MTGVTSASNGRRLGGSVRPIHRTLAGLLFSGVLLSFGLPVSASQRPVPGLAPGERAILSAGLSGSAETALLWQKGLLRAPAAPAVTVPLPMIDSASSIAGTADVRVNTPGQGEIGAADPEGGAFGSSPTCNSQLEVGLARTEERLVAAFVDGGQCDKLLQYEPMYRTDGAVPVTGLSMSGYGHSSDGGATWESGRLPAPVGGNLYGNPSIAGGPDGSVYYATLMGTPLCCDIGVSRLPRGGETWSVPVNASGSATPPPNWLHDKPWIAVDGASGSPNHGSVYVAWTEWQEVAGPVQSLEISRVLFARSTDGARTFSSPLKVSTPGPEGTEEPGFGTQIVTGPDGEIYVVWVDDFGSSYRVWFVRSLDGGVTFSDPVRILATNSIGHDQACAPGAPTRTVLNGDIRIPANLPSLAVDISGSSDPASPAYNPYRGRIYLTAPHDSDLAHPLWAVESPDESDVAFIYSTDRGTSWEDVEFRDAEWQVTRVINDDVDSDGFKTQTDQFHPNVAVDDEGRVAVSWYDRRPLGGQAAPPNWEMTVWAAVSSDGGETFGQNLQVSDEAFPPARSNPNTNWLGGCYMGLYNGIAGGDDEFLLAWGDNRDHVGPVSDMNVYFDRIALG